jgi:hypothetical protein
MRRGRRALAGICLAALSVLPGASLVAAEAEKTSSVNAEAIGQAAGAIAVGDESDSASLGGAIYSPFSTAFDTAAAKPAAYATPKRPDRNEGTPGLVTTTVATFIALGLLLALVRVLIAI